jgi:hypothetical protein
LSKRIALAKKLTQALEKKNFLLYSIYTLKLKFEELVKFATVKILATDDMFEMLENYIGSDRH